MDGKLSGEFNKFEESFGGLGASSGGYNDGEMDYIDVKLEDLHHSIDIKEDNSMLEYEQDNNKMIMAKIEKIPNKSNRKSSREAMRKMREKIMADPVKHEEAKMRERERYYRRKEQGKIKSISEMNGGEQRSQRKKWKERAKRYNDRKKATEALHKMLDEHTSPPSHRNMSHRVPQEVDNVEAAGGKSPRSSVDNSVSRSGVSRSRLREEIRRRNRYQQNVQIKALRDELIIAQRRARKYRKRLQRLEAKLLNSAKILRSKGLQPKRET